MASDHVLSGPALRLSIGGKLEDALTRSVRYRPDFDGVFAMLAGKGN